MDQIKLEKLEKPVTWPSPQDYNEAIQNLWVNSRDPELRNAVVQLSSVGLPMPRTGAFASVYRATAAGKHLAVRCFLRDIRDQEQRYAEISRFVQTDSLPYTVGFDFIREGLRVNGRWAPVLKMDWVDGLNLDFYVEKHLGTRRIDELAGAFKKMHNDLREAGIAHGDLQHGNIIVCNDELRLVDYDGMYVPAMKGWTSNEIGHRNYQHPKRDATHFGPYLDNFSAWVIYASLRALSLDKDLYRLLGGGDDCLLFRRDDFAEPNHSYAFALLDRHPNEEIRALSNFLRWQCGNRPEEVPPLFEAIPDTPQLPAIKVDQSMQQPAPVPPRNATAEVPATRVTNSNGLPDWLNSSEFNTLATMAAARSAAPVAVAGFGGYLNSLPTVEPELTAPTPRYVVFRDTRVPPQFMSQLMLLSPTVWLMVIGLTAFLLWHEPLHWLVWVCTFINYVMGYHIWATPIRDRQLATYGHITKASRVKPRVDVSAEGYKTYSVVYDFHAGTQAGPIFVQKEINEAEYEAIIKDRYHTVLYDPKDPDNNVLYAMCRYRVIETAQSAGVMGIVEPELRFSRPRNVKANPAYGWIEPLLSPEPAMHHDLAVNGIPVSATIDGAHTEFGAENEIRYFVDYTVPVNNGKVRKYRKEISAKEFTQVYAPESVTVLYDPFNPDRNVIYKFSRYLVY